MIPIVLATKREIARETILYVFERPKDFSFCAGQYVSIKVLFTPFKDDRGDFRAFSIASAPSQNDVLEFAMRKSNSAFKKNLDSLAIGGFAEMTPAVGKCILPETYLNRKIVFLVGGVGITPVRSILFEAMRNRRPETFFLFFSNRSVVDAPFFEEMKGWNAEHAINLSIIHTITESDDVWRGERGYIDVEKVQKYVGGEWGDCLFYIVGTSGFVEAMRSMLEQRGVSEDKMLSDDFGSGK